MALFAAVAAYKVYDDLLADNIRKDTGASVTIYIYTQKSLNDNFDIIEEQKVLRNPIALKRIIQVFGYSDMVRPGRYVFAKGTNNLRIMRALVTGAQQPFDITFKYAERTDDLITFWCTRLEADSNVLRALLIKSDFTSLGLSAEQNHAIFLPNTYNFYWNTSAEALLDRMQREFKLFWDSTRIARTHELKLTPGEVITLASIVQKETAKRDEMSRIAGVYYNRLRKGMLLQADPTVLFAVNDKSIKRVGGAMLQINSPYNTYKFKGLPPGPICIPDTRTIDAVLNLELHNYIYFCAREDFSGYHHFASGFSEHQRNAVRFQRALNKRGITL